MCVCCLSKRLTVSLWLPERRGFLVRACSSSVCVCVCCLSKRLTVSPWLPERQVFLVRACSSSLCVNATVHGCSQLQSYPSTVSVSERPVSERDTRPPTPERHRKPVTRTLSRQRRKGEEALACLPVKLSAARSARDKDTRGVRCAAGQHRLKHAAALWLY